ncbi:hypothetical protein ACWGTI_32945, partial [Mesorhizobium sp. ArgA1]
RKSLPMQILRIFFALQDDAFLKRNSAAGTAFRSTLKQPNCEPWHRNRPCLGYALSGVTSPEEVVAANRCIW